MTPYPVKYETLDPVAGSGMYFGPGQPQPCSYHDTRAWPQPLSHGPMIHPVPFYSPPLPHFSTAKLVKID